MNKELPDTEDNDINHERPVCSFCGKNTQPIHYRSVEEFGEPVCTLCFCTSFTKDPTNDD